MSKEKRYFILEGFHCPWENNKWYATGQEYNLATWSKDDLEAALRSGLIAPVETVDKGDKKDG